MGDSRDRWRVVPGEKVSLAARDPSSTPGAPGDKAATRAVMSDLYDQLREWQGRLWAEGKRSLLVVLQGLDAGGKDGTIRNLFQGLNPQGATVKSFTVPNAEEAAHDFLWRVHQATPPAGGTALFNRSHYEDVLVVRVHQLVPEPVWRARYDLINGFEALLAHRGTTVVKFVLHISKDEQRRRLQQRLTDPRKRWKFSLGDLEDRAHWDEYQEAYEEALRRTSTATAPWYVIPADRKWYRNWAVTTVLIDTLRELDPDYPDPPDLGSVEIV
jgi:PPK2 family polyphosphate:nucleotide phosphotransferase